MDRFRSARNINGLLGAIYTPLTFSAASCGVTNSTGVLPIEPEEAGGSQVIRDGPVSAPFPVITALALAPPFPDRGPANAPADREVLRHFGGDAFEGQPVDAGRNEGL